MTDHEHLTETQIKALITLLDDDDPEVAGHVEGKLMELGHKGLQKLESEWELQSNPEIQRRLEDLIHRIHLRGVASDLLDWRKNGGKDLLKGWFFVSKTQFPDLEFRKYRNEVNRLINKSWLQMDPGMGAMEKLEAVNHILFKMEGYGPNSSKSQFPHNSFLNYVIEQQEGNAASLGMLYLIICRQLNLPVHGVLLPGYFILMYKDAKHEFYIDVFNGGKTFSRAKLKGYLKQVNVEEKSSYFKPTSNIYMILNMIRVIAKDFKHNGREDKVADMEQLLKDIEITF